MLVYEWQPVEKEVELVGEDQREPIVTLGIGKLSGAVLVYTEDVENLFRLPALQASK